MRVFPLLKRPHLRTISTRWFDVLEDGLKKENSFVIRDNVDSTLLPCKRIVGNDLIIQSGCNLTAEVIHILSSLSLFPGNTQLTVNLNAKASWPLVPWLLAQWGPTLQTVKLYVDMECQMVKPIADALNAYPPSPP